MKKILIILFLFVSVLAYSQTDIPQEHELLDLNEVSINDISVSITHSTIFLINFIISISIWILFTIAIILHISKNKSKFDFRVINSSINTLYLIIQEYLIIFVFCLCFITLITKYIIPYFSDFPIELTFDVYNVFYFIGSLILLVIFVIKIIFDFEKYSIFKYIVNILLLMSYTMITIGIINSTLTVSKNIIMG